LPGDLCEHEGHEGHVLPALLVHQVQHYHYIGPRPICWLFNFRPNQLSMVLLYFFLVFYTYGIQLTYVQ
jgi:hypothetical protein